MDTPPQIEKRLPNEDRLSDLFKELMAEVRWRRDQEARFLTLFLSAFSIVAGGSLVFIARSNGTTYHMPVLVFAAVVTLLVGWLTYAKVKADHERYKEAAQEVVWLWKHWRFIAAEVDDAFPLPKSAEKFGTGDGWKLSLRFVAALCVAFLGLVAWLLYCH